MGCRFSKVSGSKTSNISYASIAKIGIVEMPIRKKVIAFLILSVILGNVAFYLAECSQIETTAQGVEMEVRIVPTEASPASNAYVDSPSNITFVNEDISNSTITNVLLEHRFEFNVTFQILNVTKGSFDSGVIINSTAIGFSASEIAYRANKTGMVWIRYYNMSLKSVLGRIWQGFWGFLEDVSYKIKSATEPYIHFPAVQRVWMIATLVNIVAGTVKHWVPEFPLGLALEITLIPLIIYIWRKRKDRTLR